MNSHNNDNLRVPSSPSPVGEGRGEASNSRRNFIRTAGVSAIVGLSGMEAILAATKKKPKGHSGKGLQLRFLPYDLQLRHTFTLANSSRMY
jgi:hypothetical protein